MSNIMIYKIDCNSQIHDELKNMEECTCPYCDQLLVEVNKADELCCGEQELEIIDGMNTCINCGLVHGNYYTTEYFNFYENLYRMRRKSVYHRKYHIQNVLDSISFKNNVCLTYKQIKCIHKVFIEIDSVLHKVENGRKRMISVKYIITRLLKMFGLPYKDISVTKSKMTLKYYKQYWKKIQLLIGDRIQSIVNV